MSLDEELRELIREVVREELADQAEAAVRAEIMRLEKPRRWLTVAQAAERLGLSQGGVRQRIKRGQLDSRMLDGRRYVDMEALQRRLSALLP